MDALDAILKRRSIRQYTNKPVAPETIHTLLEAAMAAPSAYNKQPWHFVAITERGVLDAIPEFHPYLRMLFEAPLALLVCGDTNLESHPGYMAQDLSAAVENILITAQAQGMGAVWLGIYPRDERMAGMRELLEIPDGFIPFALIPPPSGRFLESRVHHNKW